MSYEHEQEDIYPVDLLMSYGLSSINQLIIEHMKGHINDQVISLLETGNYSQAFDLLDKLGLSETFDREYEKWYRENQEDVIITVCDRNDCYNLRNY